MADEATTPDPTPSLPPELQERVFTIHFDAESAAKVDAIEALCGQHPDHATDLRALYSRLNRADRAFGDVDEGTPQTETPDQIGPYRIDRLLGEGGMGSVFLAHQERPVRREVALKIVKLGMDTARVLARFEMERRALGVQSARRPSCSCPSRSRRRPRRGPLLNSTSSASRLGKRSDSSVGGWLRTGRAASARPPPWRKTLTRNRSPVANSRARSALPCRASSPLDIGACRRDEACQLALADRLGVGDAKDTIGALANRLTGRRDEIGGTTVVTSL